MVTLRQGDPRLAVPAPFQLRKGGCSALCRAWNGRQAPEKANSCAEGAAGPVSHRWPVGVLGSVDAGRSDRWL